MPLHVSNTCAHHQEVKIALHSLWYHHTYRYDETRGCVKQFWPPHDKHMCSKHVEAWNKLTVKQKCCASSWLITKINILPLCFVLIHVKTSINNIQYNVLFARTQGKLSRLSINNLPLNSYSLHEAMKNTYSNTITRKILFIVPSHLTIPQLYLPIFYKESTLKRMSLIVRNPKAHHHANSESF